MFIFNFQPGLQRAFRFYISTNENLEHETDVVVASVLHGALEVLAGEVAGADKATVSSVAVLDWSILTTEVQAQ